MFVVVAVVAILSKTLELQCKVNTYSNTYGLFLYCTLFVLFSSILLLLFQKNILFKYYCIGAMHSTKFATKLLLE